MKNRILKLPVVPLASTLVLLGMLPVLPVSAAVQVVIEPEAGTVNNQVDILGVGFPATAGLDIYFSNQDVNINTAKHIGVDVFRYKKVLSVTTSSLGFFQGTFIVPESLDVSGGGQQAIFHDGAHFVYITYQGDTLIRSKTPYEMTGFAQALIGSTSGHVGDKASITGSGYKPGEDISVRFRGTDITSEYVEGSTRVNAAGQFSILVTIPNMPFGLHPFVVQSSQTGKTEIFEYQVLPQIKLDKTSAMAGQPVFVTGTGFGSLRAVVFTIGGQQASVNWVIEEAGRTSSTGNFVVSLVVPALEDGPYQLIATDVTNSAITTQLDFTVLPPPLNPVITLSPEFGRVGDVIQVSGEEFRNLRPITFSINGVAIEPQSTVTSTANGTFSGSFVIPQLPGGNNTLRASDGEMQASAVFNVYRQTEVTPLSGRAGTAISVTGSGLPASIPVLVYFNSTPLATNPSGVTTNPNGSLAFTFYIPPVAPGEHSVEIRIGNTIQIEKITTAAEVFLSSQSSAVGRQLNITCSGFAPNQPALITFSGIHITALNTNEAGSLNVVFTVPHVAEGTHEVRVEVAGTAVTRNVTTIAGFTVEPLEGPVSTQIAVTGTGFGPDKPLELTWDGKAVPSSTATKTNADGAFSFVFAAPVAGSGEYEIKATDGVITRTAVFTVEATVPAAPVPVSPIMYSWLRGQAAFEWQAVNYPYMDFTYDFQVIRNLSQPELVLGKPGLTEAGYTLARDEKLEKAAPENPYYWRVRATDAAGNTGAWSEAGEFYYGFHWPAWLTWVLVGLGILVLVMIIYLLRRQIAYLFY